MTPGSETPAELAQVGLTLLVGLGALGIAVAVGLALWRRGRAGRASGPPADADEADDPASALGDAGVASLAKRGEYEAAGDLRMSQGDYAAAADLYLRAGKTQKACLCYVSLKQPGRAAELYRGSGRLAEAAHYFQRDGAWQAAADCLDEIGSKREAAELYERAEQWTRAATALEAISDFENAARLYERAGLPERAARAWFSSGSREPSVLRRAAALFEVAGDLKHAAECFAGAGSWAKAAELFEELDERQLAAQAYERAQDFAHAAELFECAGALPEARANYEKAGETLKVAEISLRLGQLMSAGEAFYALGSYERAIESLQGIPGNHPSWNDATFLLGRIFLEKNLYHRAREKLASIAHEPPREPRDVEILALLAEVHERSGDALQALGLVEQIADADPRRPGVEEWMERLQENAWGGSTSGPRGAAARYELRDEIGRGGMGVVHLAQDRELERAVAIKFLPVDLAQNATCLQMFRQEARAAAAMNHPSIVHVYDVTVISGRPCIVMEYVEGKTVRQLIRQEGSPEKRPLPPRRVAEIARDICDGLAYAHLQQVIHRDVKPGNIIVSNRGQAKLMDFGISKVLERGVEGQTKPRGTPQYMPPEQILGQEVDGRTDLYALGISIFEGVTGVRPFRGDDVVQQQLEDPLPDPRLLRPDLPERLADIIKTACEKTPADRYQSAREMADALSVFIAKASE